MKIQKHFFFFFFFWGGGGSGGGGGSVAEGVRWGGVGLVGRGSGWM